MVNEARPLGATKVDCGRSYTWLKTASGNRWINSIGETPYEEAVREMKNLSNQARDPRANAMNTQQHDEADPWGLQAHINKRTHIDATYTTPSEEDPVNKPEHYMVISPEEVQEMAKQGKGVEVMDIAKALVSEEEMRGWYKVNAIKYQLRADKKGKPAQDRKKNGFMNNEIIALLGEE